MKYKTAILLVSLLAVVFIAGCTSPSPSPSPAASPTASPAPTLTGGSDRANVTLTYLPTEYGSSYEFHTAQPGYVIYTIDVRVTTDKPVYTDGTWFSIDYRSNSTDTIKNYQPWIPAIDYPSKIIDNSSAPATGRLLISVPAPGNGSYGPVPVYYKPLDQQNGTYKVYDRVVGYIRT